MGEDKKEFFTVHGLSEASNPFKDFWKVAERQFNERTISIFTDGAEISKEKADKLMENTYKGALIATKINKGPIGSYEKDLPLLIPKGETAGYLMNDLKAHKELLNEDGDSQTAAVIHEMIHGIQEDIGAPSNFYSSNETVPLAAEFIFGGESRRSFFVYLTDEVIDSIKRNKGLFAHPFGWKKSLQMLSEAMNVDIDLMNESAESVVGKLEKVRNIEESDKIALIQKFIEQGKASP